MRRPRSRYGSRVISSEGYRWRRLVVKDGRERPGDPMTEATPEQIVAFLTGAKVMTDGASYNAAWEMGRKQGLREAADQIERLREHIAALQLVATAHDAEIARLRAALQIVREENDRAKRQFTNVSNKILDEACRALEPKP